jgi:hypothetical protein
MGETALHHNVTPHENPNQKDKLNKGQKTAKGINGQKENNACKQAEIFRSNLQVMGGYCAWPWPWPSAFTPADDPLPPPMPVSMLVVDMTELWLGRRRSALLLMLTGLLRGIVVDAADMVRQRSCCCCCCCASAEDDLCPAPLAADAMTFFLESFCQLSVPFFFFFARLSQRHA